MHERDSPESRASAESRDRRHRLYDKVIAMRAAGATLGEIAIALGMSVGTVHRWVHRDGFPERATHRRATDPFADAIRRLWAAGYRSATAVCQALQADGFTGSRRTVQRELGRLGFAGDILPGADPGTMENSPSRDELSRAMRPPSPRHIDWLFGRPDTAGKLNFKPLST